MPCNILVKFKKWQRANTCVAAVYEAEDVNSLHLSQKLHEMLWASIIRKFWTLQKQKFPFEEKKNLGES